MFKQKFKAAAIEQSLLPNTFSSLVAIDEAGLPAIAGRKLKTSEVKIGLVVTENGKVELTIRQIQDGVEWSSDACMNPQKACEHLTTYLYRLDKNIFLEFDALTREVPNE